MATLSTAQAKAFYDRFGAKQDKQDFYEGPAVEWLLAHGGFPAARDVFELGCGTGRLAETLLTGHLAADCTYRGIDVSSTMIALAAARIAPFSARAAVSLTDGSARLPAPNASADRFLATYVLDLLSDDAIRSVMGEAHRILRPEGRLCLTGLTPATTLPSSIVMGIWSALFGLRPALVGGCRPIRLLDYLRADQWEVRHHHTVTAYGIVSEILIAVRRTHAGG